ncbi:MAG TPA: acetylxylan esterase [Prosthecobacter sp.]|nr:acetylxylan esterase [Prosthecobacter sp.]
MILPHIFPVAFCLVLATDSLAQKPKSDPAPLPPLNRFPHMVQEWMVGQVRAAEERGNARRAALKTRGDAEAYVQSVRERIRECFGPEPERTPLNARVTRVVERDAYNIEMVVFESRPGFLVTGNLYVPKGRPVKMPGVIGVCGHSTNGKAAEAYQAFSQGLARMGYVCLIIDPPGQGERFQYLNGFKSRFNPGTGEHIQAGNQQTLVGEFLGSWFAWDGIRALDYLLTRPEVDPAHVGVTGNSGGGTQTTWLCGVEPRWTMAAPACFVTTFRRNAENELPADTEQCPPRVLALDLDHSDFLAAQAPKPTLILAQEKDYFDARGATEAHQRLKTLYTLLGQPDNTRLHIGGDYHGYSQVNREGMYRFFNLATGVSDAQAEPGLTYEKDETLWCFPEGQAGKASRTLFSFTEEKAARLAQERGPVEGVALQDAIRSVLKIPEAPGSAPDYRILRATGARQYPAKGYCAYAVETEPGIHALVTRLHDDTLTSRPPLGQKRAVLYLSHRSADEELRGEPLIQQLLAEEKGAAFYACDLRGIGDSQPDICGINQMLRPYGSDYFISAHSLMLDRPYLGQRVFDALRVIEWLAGQGHEEIHLAGRGWGALAAVFAAVLEPRARQVTLKNGLSSYLEVARTEDYKWPYSMLPPNILAHFDLPDCHAALRDRSLRLLEPWGAADGMNP